jgi:hypothetical protein
MFDGDLDEDCEKNEECLLRCKHGDMMVSHVLIEGGRLTPVAVYI